MRILGGRSLAFSCFSFIASLFVSKYISEEIRRRAVLPLIIVSGMLFVISAVLFLFRRKNTAKRIAVPAFALVAAAAATVLCLSTVDRDIRAAHEYDGKTVSLVAEITEEISEYPYYSAYLGKAVSIDGEAADLGVRIELEYDAALSRDDVIEGEFLLTLPAEDLYGYPMRDSYVSDGIYLIASADGLEKMGVRDKDLLSYVKDLSEYLVSLSERIFGGKDGGLNSALILGEKSGLEDSFERDIRRLGLSHLLALSGMHLSVIVGGLEKIFRRLTLPRTLIPILMIPATLFYCAVVGFPLSVMRAGIMLIIFYVSTIVGREYDSLTSLFVSAAVICGISPGAVWDAGLALSFFTMLSIVTVSNPLNTVIHRIPRVKTIPKKIRFPLISGVFVFTSGFFAVIFSLPVMWLYFSEMSFMGILLTAVISPLVNIIIVLGILAMVFSFIPYVGVAVAAADIFICTLVSDICGCFSKMRNITFSLRYPGVGVILAVFFLLMLLVLLFARRRLVLTSSVSAAALAALVICIAVNYHADSSLSRAVYTYEDKNETLSVVSEGKTAVLDMSSGSYGIIRKTLYVLENECSTEIEQYIITHYHTRHISAFDKLSDNEIVRSIYLPEPKNDDEEKICSGLAETAGKKGCAVFIYSTVTDTPDVFGNTEILVRRGELSRSTHPTFAVTVKCGDGEGLAYMSSSFWESNPSYTRDIKNGDFSVIRGRHGPVAKESVRIDFTDTDSNDLLRYVFEKRRTQGQ
ncbi:MAG: ComEC/Rec2 family competence protein [Clostridia bacterium]|nr:ComEC/Rec2 family competence protein [Clostridia bacterium]